MSPRTVIEEAVHGQDGDVMVRRDGDRVAITWTCGGSRIFGEATLASTIEYLEKLSAVGVWSLLRDSDKQQFVARIDNGTLRVGDGAGAVSAREEVPSVPWEHLKAAAQDALKAPAGPAKKKAAG